MRHPHFVGRILLGVPALLLLAAPWSTARADQAAVNNTTVTKTEPADDNTETVSKTEVNHVRVQSGDNQQPGEAAPPAQPGNEVEQTTITQKQPATSNFRDEAAGIKPQVGFLTLNDPFNNAQTRAVIGATVDVNFLRRLGSVEGRPYFGLSLGVFYSHLGFSGSDFFGLSNPTGNDGGTNYFQIPINLKMGYTIKDALRLAMHVGPEVVYNNLVVNVPATSLQLTDSNWSTKPNLGFDVEIGIGKNVGLLLRPDWTFAGGNTLFMGTLGLDLAIA